MLEEAGSDGGTIAKATNRQTAVHAREESHTGAASRENLDRDVSGAVFGEAETAPSDGDAEAVDRRSVVDAEDALVDGDRTGQAAIGAGELQGPGAGLGEGGGAGEVAGDDDATRGGVVLVEDILAGGGGDAGETAEGDGLRGAGTREEESTALDVESAGAGQGQARRGGSVVHQERVQRFGTRREGERGATRVTCVVGHGHAAGGDELLVFRGEAQGAEAVAEAAEGAVGDEGVAEGTRGRRGGANRPREDADAVDACRGSAVDRGATANQTADQIGGRGHHDITALGGERRIKIRTNDHKGGVVAPRQACEGEDWIGERGRGAGTQGVIAASQGDCSHALITQRIGQDRGAIRGGGQTDRRHRGTGSRVHEGDRGAVVDPVGQIARLLVDLQTAAVADSNVTDAGEVANRVAGGQASAVGKCHLGIVNRQRSGEGVGRALEGQRVAVGTRQEALNDQGTAAGDLAGIGGIAALVDGQGAAADGDRTTDGDGARVGSGKAAAGNRGAAPKVTAAGEGADGLVATVEIEDGVQLVRKGHCRTVTDSTAAGELDRAFVDVRSAGVAVVRPGEQERARTRLGQGDGNGWEAASVFDAGRDGEVRARIVLVDDQFTPAGCEHATGDGRRIGRDGGSDEDASTDAGASGEVQDRPGTDAESRSPGEAKTNIISSDRSRRIRVGAGVTGGVSSVLRDHAAECESRAIGRRDDDEVVGPVLGREVVGAAEIHRRPVGQRSCTDVDVVRRRLRACEVERERSCRVAGDDAGAGEKIRAGAGLGERRGGIRRQCGARKGLSSHRRVRFREAQRAATEGEDARSILAGRRAYVGGRERAGVNGERVGGCRRWIQRVVPRRRIQGQGAAAVLGQRRGERCSGGAVGDRAGDRGICITADREIAHGGGAATEDERATGEGRSAGVAGIERAVGVRLGDGAAKFNRLTAYEGEGGSGGRDAEGNIVHDLRRARHRHGSLEEGTAIRTQEAGRTEGIQVAAHAQARDAGGEGSAAGEGIGGCPVEIPCAGTVLHVAGHVIGQRSRGVVVLHHASKDGRPCARQSEGSSVG